MADDTRDRVLNAAGPIFARKGFEGATVREICAAADVNLASVNYHFGGKETLYLEAVKLAHEQKTIRVPLPEVSRVATREEQLHGFVRTILQRLLGGGDDDWQTELLIREMIRPTHACAPLVEDFIRPQFNRLLGIIDEFVGGEVTPGERQQLAFSIVGQCLQYRVAGGFVSLLLEPESRETVLDIEALANQITRFSIAALSHWSAHEQPEWDRSSSSRDGTSSRTHGDGTPSDLKTAVINTH